MKKDFNVVYDFVCSDREMVAKGGSFSFRQYTDRTGVFGIPGREIIFDDGSLDKRGHKCGKGFSLNQSHYNLQAREGQIDNNQLPLKDFFLNHPVCEGSPNGTYATSDGTPLTIKDLKDRESLMNRIKLGEVIQYGVKFKLKEDAKDAEIKLKVGKRRAEAQVSAANLDELTLKEVASMIGVFGEADELMQEQVFEWAGRKPLDYFKLLESGDRAFRAIIRVAIANGVLDQRGVAIYYNKELVGANEDLAVERLQTDKVMLESLQEASGLNTQLKAKKVKTN